jgi:hypothetical protein
MVLHQIASLIIKKLGCTCAVVRSGVCVYKLSLPGLEMILKYVTDESYNIQSIKASISIYLQEPQAL